MASLFLFMPASFGFSSSFRSPSPYQHGMPRVQLRAASANPVKPYRLASWQLRSVPKRTDICATPHDSDQVSQNEGDEATIPRTPSPEIEPAEVVNAQLKALRELDIATVFEFASPKNKARTGPISQFSEMIKGRAYNVMLGHTSAEILSSLLVSPCRYQQRVLIKGANGTQTIFSWSLSKQEEGPFQGCWLTDSVHRDESQTR